MKCTVASTSATGFSGVRMQNITSRLIHIDATEQNVDTILIRRASFSLTGILVAKVHWKPSTQLRLALLWFVSC